MSPEEGVKRLKNPGDDPQFPQDWETCQKIRKGDLEASISTKSGVERAKAYAYQVYQDFACLTESEYVDMIGESPSPDSKFGVKFNGPDKPETNMFTVSLRGLPPDELAAVRKVRLSYTDGFTHNAVMLNPDEQVLKDQGQRIFKHLASQELQKRPASWKLGQRSFPPKSYQELKEAAQLKKDKAATEQAFALAALQRQNRHDEIMGSDDDDEWGEGEQEDKETMPPVPQPARKAGVDYSALSDDEAPKPVKKRQTGKAAKSAPKSTASTAAPSAARGHVQAIAAAERSERMERGSAGGVSGSKKSTTALDTEMKYVADKHLATGAGTSFNCLGNLLVENFLADHEDDRSLGAILRGVISSGGY